MAVLGITRKIFEELAKVTEPGQYATVSGETVRDVIELLNELEFQRKFEVSELQVYGGTMTWKVTKKDEPRVMTLEELWNVGRVWESSAPPYLWLEKNRSIYKTISYWCAWRDIYEMIHGRHDKYTDENYGSGWRVWNLQPTPEQMRDTKWEGEKE